MVALGGPRMTSTARTCAVRDSVSGMTVLRQCCASTRSPPRPHPLSSLAHMPINSIVPLPLLCLSDPSVDLVPPEHPYSRERLRRCSPAHSCPSIDSALLRRFPRASDPTTLPPPPTNRSPSPRAHAQQHRRPVTPPTPPLPLRGPRAPSAPLLPRHDVVPLPRLRHACPSMDPRPASTFSTCLSGPTTLPPPPTDRSPSPWQRRLQFTHGVKGIATRRALAP